MFKEKKDISEWKQIENSLKEWLLAVDNYKKEYGDEFTDEIESVYEKEWEIILKIKKWTNKNQFEELEDHGLSDLEFELFNQLSEKSKHVSFDFNHNLPYSMLFFLPISLWNDDPDSKNHNVILTTHNILPKQITILEDVVKKYLTDYLYSSLPESEKYLVTSFPILGGNNIKNLYKGSMFENQKLGPFSLLDNEKNKVLSDLSKEHWLSSGLLPIIIRSNKYSNIADTDFTNDNVFINNLNAVYNTNRIIAGFPTYLEESLFTLENMNWDLWRFEYIDKDISDDILKKEVLFTTQRLEDAPISLKVCVKDYYKKNKIIEHSYEKEVISFDDIQASMVLQNMDERLFISIKNENISEHKLKIQKHKTMKEFVRIKKSLKENTGGSFLTIEKAPEGTLLN